MKNIIPCLFLFFALSTIFGCAKLKNASTDTVPIVSNEHIGLPHYNLFEPIMAKTELDGVVKGAVFFKLDTAELQRLYLERPAHFSFQLPDNEGLPSKFFFDKKQVTSPNMRLYDQTKMPLVVSEGIHYRQSAKEGIVAGISIFENKLSAIFATQAGNFSLSELTDSPGEYILFKESMLVEQPAPFTCTPLYAPGYEMPKYGEYNQTDAAKTTAFNPNDPVVRVFVECDQEMLAMSGGTVQGVYEYVTSLFNFVSIIYENDGILLQLSEMMVWTAGDPYNGSLGDALNTYVQHWHEANMSFNGDLAHLLKGYSGGGLAWVDMVCNPDLPFGVSGIPNAVMANFPNYIYSVYVVAHELGHNVGSPHTHNCSWGPNNDQALDNCATPEGSCDFGPPPANGGTIMSYCSDFNLLNGFGPEPANLIRTLISQKTCLKTLQFVADCQMDSIEVVLECLADPTPTDPMDNQFSVRLNVKGNGAPNSLRATDLSSGQTWLFSYNTYLTIGPFDALQGLRHVQIEDLNAPACTTERAVFPPSDCYRPDLCLQHVWDNMVGGSEEDLIEAIAALPSGGYVNVGQTRSSDGDFTTTFGDWDFFVQKLNEDGSTAWIKTFGGESYDFGYDIVGMADGGALVVGNTNSVTGLGSGNKGSSDAFALRLDANGNEVWKKLYGGSGHDQFFSMIAMPGGDFAFAGQSWSNNGDVSGNQGMGDGWVLRANTNGDIAWSHLYGDDADNLYANIALGHGNNFALTGQSSSSNTSPNILPIATEVAFDGTMNWNKTYNVTQNGNGVGLFPNDNGGYLLLHQNTRPQVARLDGNGNLLDTWEVTSPRNSHFVDAIKLPNNRIAVAGHRNGLPGVPGTGAVTRDFWTYILDGNGNLLFERTYGLYRFDEAYAIAPTNQGGYILAGRSETYNESHQMNVWTVKFGPDICTQAGTCYLTAQASNIECHDNGTINDLTDDVFTFDLLVDKVGDCGSSWTADSIVSNYGLPVAMGPYPISAGPKTLDIHDYLDLGISTSLSVNPPGACSYGISYCADNLLINQGFETPWAQLYGWQTEGNVQPSSNPHKGQYAAQICEGVGNITQVIPAVPGKEYTASAWVRKASASTGYSKFTLRFLTSTWQPLLDEGQVFTNTKYEQIVFTKTAPANAAYVQVLLWKEAGGCLETDDWELCEGTVEPPCEITIHINSVVCYDNNTSNDASDDTFHFYFDVSNSGQGTTYSTYIPETGFTQSGGYGWPYVYGSFKISDGPITLVVTDNADPNCSASVTIQPPAPCSAVGLPDFELSSFIAAQLVGGSNPQIHPNDEVVAGTTVYFPDHFAELYFPLPMPTFNVTIGAYLSNDFTLDANDLLLTSGTRTIDAAVQSYGFTEGIFGNNSQIPPNTPAGNYYIIVKYDSENAIAEADETNNMGILPIIVTSGSTGAIDLELSLAQLNANPPIYSAYSVTATLKNKGVQAATGVKVGFAKPAGVVYTGGNEYTASQGSFDPNGTQYWSVGTIPAGGTATLTVNYFLLQPSAPIAYAQVTAANEQDGDSTPGNGTPPTPNEDDEAATGSGPPQQAPDLTISDLQILSPSVQAGQVLNYNFDAANIGTVAVPGNFTIKSYISTDQALSANDVQEGTIPTGNFAAGFTVQNVPGASTIPVGLAAGQYYLIVKIDANNIVAEGNEANNLVMGTFTVVGTGDPCDAITITPSPGKITIAGFNAPHVLIKVFRPNWTTAFECLDGTCTNPVVVTGLTNGSHYVEIKLMNAYWGEICMENQYVGVNNMAAPDDARQRISFERVYPNPAKYSVNLEVYSPEDQSAVLDFYDQQGREVYRLKTELKEGVNNLQVFVFDWKSGTYNVIARGEKTGLPAYMRFMKIWEE